MSTRLRQLERVHRLRAAHERLREAEFAAAQRKVLETDEALCRVQVSRLNAVREGREGLLGGEWERWWMGESSDALAARVLGELDRVREERVTRAGEVRQLWMEGRRAAEQARLLEDSARAIERAEAEKRAQAESDDRFAARSHWNREVARQRAATR